MRTWNRRIVGYSKEGNVRLPIYEDIIIKTEYTMEFDVKKLRRKFSKSELLLMDYWSTECIGFDTDPVTYNQLFRDRFNSWLKSPEFDGEFLEGFKDVTINKAMHSLVKEKILLRVIKGSYYVNPQYFYRGKPELRDMWIDKVFSMAEKFLEQNKENGQIG